MKKLNEYEITLHGNTSFEVELSDDNYIIKAKLTTHNETNIPLNKIHLFVVETMESRRYRNVFHLIKTGDVIPDYENWLFIAELGDFFLFQKRY
jgi:hypothetical protein